MLIITLHKRKLTFGPKSVTCPYGNGWIFLEGGVENEFRQ